LIGSTEIDLSNYVTTTDLSTALADYVTSTGLAIILADYATTSVMNTALSGKQDTISDLASIRSGAAAGVTAVQPSATAGLLKNDGTVDTTTYASEAGTESLISSTVGWTGKNKFPNTATTRTVADIVFTANSDGSIKMNGTSSGTTSYEIFGSESNTNYLHLDVACKISIVNPIGGHALFNIKDKDGNVITLTNNEVEKDIPAGDYKRIYIYFDGSFAPSNLTIYPMLRDVRISDATYEPHHDTVEVSKADKVASATNGNLASLDSTGNLTDSGESVGDIYSAMAFNGVKNLVRLQYDNGYTTTMGTITHTYNNGEVTLSAGTASAQSYSFPAISTAGFELEADRAYVLTGVPSNAPAGVRLVFRYNNGSNVTVATDEGSGASFTFTSAMKNATNYHLMINVASGTVIPAVGIVIRPMIRYAEDKGTAFEKHTMNNRELTSAVQELSSYLEQTVTLSTSADTTVTFSDASITTDSCIDIATSEWGLVPSDVTVTTGVCTVTLPKADSAHSVKCRIYVR
jgi:hypothetical protein